MRVSVAVLGLLGWASAAAAQAPLTMKGGQWQSTITGMGPQPMTHSFCLAEQALDQSAAPPEMTQRCSKRDVTRIANGVKMDFVCNGMTMSGTATMLSENAYRTEMNMTMSGGQTMRMVTESKWLGPCKPGEKPVNAGR